MYTLGIDGGGSKTAAAIIDDCENVMGKGLGGATNTNFMGREEAVDSFKTAIGGALESAGLRPSDIGCVGGTFAMVLDEALSAIGIQFRPIGVSEPQVVFERAGLADTRGVALVAGTGSSCFGRDGHGGHFHAGGWGAILGDEGSAYDIGLRGIRRALIEMDGRVPETLLSEYARSYFETEKVCDVLRACGIRVNQRLVAGFAARVSEAAHRGDETAIAILEEAAENLGELATFVARRLFEERDAFPVVLGGGVFRAGEIVVGVIRAMFAPQFPNARVVVADGDPGEAVARITRREYLRRLERC